jgi:ribosomal protein S18 acetylase RimI-like enzyme
MVLTIRTATIVDLHQISEIHAESIPYSINSILGIERLNTLYSVFFSNPDHYLIVAEEGGLIIGFISGTSNYSSLMKEAKGSVSLKQLLVLTRKIGIVQLVKMSLDWVLIDYKFKRLTNFYYFSSWGVRENVNPIAGTLLFRRLLQDTKNTLKDSIIVNVSFDNEKVIKMYKSLGFKSLDKSLGELILKLSLRK